MSSVLYTKVSFARNLKGVKFSPRITNSEQKDMLKLSLDAIKDCGLKGSPLNELGKNVIDNLIATEQINPAFVDDDLTNKGYASGEGVNIEIGGENHILISSTDKDVFSAYAKAKEVDKKLCNKLNFAYNDKYGFLFPDIRNLGSGMSIEVEMLLPAMTKLNAIKTLPKSHEKLLFNIECISENGVYLISTGTNLGYTEKNICELTHSYINKILKCEIEASKTLAKEDMDEVLDKNARAKAILNNCVKITPEEACLLIGDILIAINADIEKDITIKQIHKLLNLVKINKNNYKNLSQEIKKVLKD